MRCQEVLPCGHRTDDLQATCATCRERFQLMEQENGYTTCAAAAASGAGAVAVEVRTVGGDVFAKLRASPAETIGELKQRLFLCSAERRVGQLICGCTPLTDKRRVEECPAGDDCPPGTIALTLVCTGLSSLATHLERLGYLDDEGSLSDVADSVFESEYQTSARHQPRAAEIHVALPQETRTQVVAWLGSACEATLIDDALLHGAVLTLDRYAASCGERINEASLLKLSLASLCTEMKLSNEDDFPSGHWQRVLLHLSQGREQLPTILNAEAAMLRRLNFIVGVPTPLTFLTGLGMRFAMAFEEKPLDGRPGQSTPAAVLQLGLAHMLVELALYDTELEYSYSPAILGSSALGAAMLVLGPLEVTGMEVEAVEPRQAAAARGGDGAVEFAALRQMHETLLNDLASYCPGICGLDVVVRECERRLLEFWRQCSGPDAGRMAGCFGNLRQRHARSRRNAQAAGGGTALLTLRPEWGLERYYALHNASRPS